MIILQVNTFARDPIDPNIIYVGGSSNSPDASVLRPAWFIKSTNGVEGIWETLLPVQTEHVYFNNVVDDICITTNPKAIYLGMGGFVLGSKDEGKTWATLITDPDHSGEIFSIESSPKDEKHLVAGNGQIFLESLDAGKTWIRLRKPANGMVWNLNWDKQTDNLYVATIDHSGVYVLPNASSVRLRDMQ